MERPVRILDVGGTEGYWKMGKLNDDQVFVTLLNLTQVDVTMPNMTSIAGDARKIQESDLSFDIVFSNSVIEHVGTYKDQMQMAKEVHRIGKHYFVQTPNKYFPLEPHFLFPFFQFLPITDFEFGCCRILILGGLKGNRMRLKQEKLWRVYGFLMSGNFVRYSHLPKFTRRKSLV